MSRAILSGLKFGSYPCSPVARARSILQGVNLQHRSSSNVGRISTGSFLYTPDHEWLSIKDDDTGNVGITEHAARSLGDIVYVELLESGASVKKGGLCIVSRPASSLGL